MLDYQQDQLEVRREGGNRTQSMYLIQNLMKIQFNDNVTWEV